MPLGALSRSVELAAVDDFVAAAMNAPSGLVIAGEAGIGKTTVWVSAVDRARAQGFKVLSARVGQAESVLAYTTVADLLAGVDEELLDELPEVQRVAVKRILLRAGGEGPETGPWVAAAALVSLVEALARVSPVLVAIDDVQWLDSSSQTVIPFATRRFRGRVGVLVTERTDREDDVASGWLQTSRPDGVARLRVGPMSLGALHKLISERLGRSLPRPALATIAEVSAGNPFYALEFARALPPGHSARSDAVLPATLAELMRNRTGRFGDAAGRVLLAASCVVDATLELIAAATGTTAQMVVELLEQPESDGLVSLDGNQIRFSHPLLARGVYTHAGAPARRRMHRALAEVEPQPELKARHMALGASSANPRVLAALDAAAQDARNRGAPAAAAELIDLARRLGDDTALRRVLAAGHHFQAGDTAAARRLIESSLDSVPSGPLRAIVLLLLAGICIYDNGFPDAGLHLRDALDHAAQNHALMVQALVMLSFTQAMSYCWDDSLETARQAVVIGEQHPNSRLSQALAHLATMSFMAGEPVDEARLQRALELEDFTDDVSLQFRASAVSALLLAFSGRLPEAESQMLAVRRLYLDRGAERDLMAVAGYRTMIAMWQGKLADAAVIAEEAMERSEQLGGDDINVIPLSVRAAVAAYQGREGDARRDAVAALDTAQRLGVPSMAAWPMMTLGFVNVSVGDYAAALDVLEPNLFVFQTRPCTDPLNGWGLPDAIEAMIGTGRLDGAEALIDKWESHGRRLDRAWVLALAARCRAMLLAAQGNIDAAVGTAQKAVHEHERLPMPFERARTLLLLGQVQRRKRLKLQAVDSLGEALRMFEELGTPLWSERAQRELARTNVSPGRDVALTPSEQRVAELAASGMTNTEIARVLFISHKTVEHNMTRIYQKLGIRSRAELGQHMARPKD